MLIEKCFNKRAASLIEVQSPIMRTNHGLALGIKMEFFRVPEDPDRSRISMHLTPDEALTLSLQLIHAAQAVWSKS